MNLAALWFPEGPAGILLLIVALVAICTGIYMGKRGK